jgi:hypothetical protein
MTDPYTEIHSRAPDEPGPARQVASGTADAVSTAAGDVAGTAKEQAREVVGEMKTQTRSLAAQTRDRVSEQARVQNDRVVDGLRRMADEFEEMARSRGESPAGTAVNRVADGGRRVADYLSKHGPEGVLAEVQDFARRRPGAFLATALVSGFVVGRLGKGVLGAGAQTSRPVDSLTGYRLDAGADLSAPSQSYREPGIPTPGGATYVSPAAVTGEPPAISTPTAMPYTEGGAAPVPPSPAGGYAAGYPDDVAVGTATPPPESYEPPGSYRTPEEENYRRSGGTP